MRHRGPSKQRVWLGSGRYSCCGGRRDANTHTDSDTHYYSDRDPNAYGESHANAYPHSATHADTKGGTLTQGASHASA